MGVVAGRAWRLLVHHMLLVQERPSLVVDEIALVVALVAERIDLERLRERVVDLIVALENRLVARPGRAADWFRSASTRRCCGNRYRRQSKRWCIQPRSLAWWSFDRSSPPDGKTDCWDLF